MKYRQESDIVDFSEGVIYVDVDENTPCGLCATLYPVTFLTCMPRCSSNRIACPFFRKGELIQHYYAELFARWMAERYAGAEPGKARE